MSRKVLKIVGLLLLFCLPIKLVAQRQLNPTIDRGPKSKIELIFADSLIGTAVSGINPIRTFMGHVKFLHRGVYLSGNKIVHNSGSNNLVAYGNIRINQGDTLTITGDTLYYDGSTRFARIHGRRVILTDDEMTLESKRMHYNLNSDIAYYPVPGIINQDSIQLSSKEGFYNTETKLFNYFGDVEILHPDFVLCTDSLDYDSQSKKADFKSFTTISSPDGKLSAIEGYYFTDSKKAKFYGNAKFANDEYTLDADTLDFNMSSNEGFGIGNVAFFSKADSLYLNGDYGEKISSEGFTSMTGNALMRSVSDNDTLFLRAEYILAYQFIEDALPKDTLSLDSLVNTDSLQIITTDSLQVIDSLLTSDTVESLDSTSVSDPLLIEANIDSLDTAYINSVSDSLGSLNILSTTQTDSTLIDSVENEIDKVQFIKAFGDVQIYRNDFQAKCDSLNYNLLDSVITFIGTPMIWSAGNQLEGDLITAQMVNNKIRSLFLDQHSFVISQDSAKNFNQIKGREIKAFFDVQSKINRVEVEGNGESIYFAVDEINKLIGLNRVECSRMRFSFKNQKVQRIVFLGNPESQLIPPGEIGEAQIKLDNFSWEISTKPTKEAVLGSNIAVEKVESEIIKESLNSDL